MHYWKLIALFILITAVLSVPSFAPAQVSVQIGPEPGCPYGYYDFAPYNCAPYGYYGPEWFSGGVFIGAGPWFHGPHDFHGNVDNRFDPHHGYVGPHPERGGNWYELVGSSYDRTTYGFEIATTPEQDEALIQTLNSSPNRSHFHIVTRNCADFVKEIINFYQPKALQRSYVADVGISTPKQMGKTLVAFEKRHPELEVSRFIIPQVPGNRPRSKTVHRVMGSFLTSKKYIIPTGVASPIFAGSVAAVFIASGGGRFNPASNDTIFALRYEPELPLTAEERRADREELKDLLARADLKRSARNDRKAWDHVQSEAEYGFDRHGRPVLETDVAAGSARVGITVNNVLAIDAPPQLIQTLLVARLQSELQKSSVRKVSGAQIDRDLQLLRQAMEEDGVLSHTDSASGFATANSRE